VPHDQRAAAAASSNDLAASPLFQRMLAAVSPAASTSSTPAICTSDNLSTTNTNKTSNSSTGGASKSTDVNDVFPDSKPLPGQEFALSTTPLKSSIPKGGTTDEKATWEFPSVQRFYNALNKKGWTEQARPQDMAATVSIHNAVNEKCWQEILRYERLHSKSCGNPKLLRFRGRPRDFSPKAQFMHYFAGHVLPFDRHDWIIDRCGTEVRYVIDYYTGAVDPKTIAIAQMKHQAAWYSFQNQQRTSLKADDPLLKTEIPPPPPLNTPPTFHLDVRPAVSVGGLIDRFRMFVLTRFQDP
jgi:cytochrome c heme-lyase